MRFFFKSLVWSAAVFLAACASADKQWVRSFPQETAEYKFYVGRGTSAGSEGAAFNKAVKDAYDQAARENFGVERRFSSETYQTETDATLTERTVEQGYAARFDNFDKVDQYIENTKDRYDVWLLYRFSKKSIAKERERLRAEKSQPEKRELSVVGSSKNKTKGILEIETVPADGAVVYVDGDRYGLTPLRLIGALATGKHTLRIDHPHYKTVSEDVIIVPNKTVSVKKTLVPAYVAITVSTDPVNAEVFLDERKMGTAPVSFQAPVGKKASLRLFHPETEEMITLLDLKKGENKRLSLSLVEKTGRFSVFSFPGGASVYLDRKKVGETPLRTLPIARGSHSFTLEREGYAPVTESFFAKGGEEISRNIELKKQKAGMEFIGSRTAHITNSVDKFHQYEEVLPPKTAPNISPAAGPEEILLSLMRWSSASPIIRGRTSYKADEKGGTEFFVFLSFDAEAYRTLFAERMVQALKNAGEQLESSDGTLDCFYESESEGQILCRPEPLKTSDTIFVKTGPVAHGFWTDKAPFERFVLMTRRDGRREKILPYEKRTVSVTVYDRRNNKQTALRETVYVLKFITDKNRNVIFMPMFQNGFESYVFVSKTDIKPSDISRVVLEISPGRPAEDPFPPVQKNKKKSSLRKNRKRFK